MRSVFGKGRVCHETIYQWVYHIRPDLKPLLPRHGTKYRHKRGTKARSKRRREADKRWITERPAVVDARSRIGDWEGDTVIGVPGRDRLLTYADRLSGKAKGIKVPGGDGLAEAIAGRTVGWLRRLPKAKRHTITYDRGTEFSDHEYVEANTPLQVYFAHPYHSWERGANENTNGLYRQFFPKKASLDAGSQREVDKVTRLLNTRPRKRHQYRTPDEVFRNGK